LGHLVVDEVGEGIPVTGMLASAGASSVAHGVHYSILGIGILGLFVLLAPGLRAPSRPGLAEPVDEHARRVQALRIAAASGQLASGAGLPGVRLVPASEQTVVAEQRPLWLPLAVVGAAAAAGVHAAFGPAHFREGTMLGLFFAASALAQISWSVAVVVRATPGLLRLGVVGNIGLVGLWLTTRTVGLPGFLPGPEAVGPWDLACVTWELVGVVGCLRALGDGAPYRLDSWVRWDRRAQAWAALAVVGLGLLSISGAGS
jgi:hypothetical protein